MSVTAIVTNHDYARFLPQCIESAMLYCDEILVFDDGSTDDSLEVLERYPVKVWRRKKATGDPIWGSEKGALKAQCERTIFLDADNWLIGKPPLVDADYTYCDLKLGDVYGNVMRGGWTYANWPLTAKDAIENFKTRLIMPVPWGGVWRTSFLRGKKWTRWPSTAMAADFRTCIDWMRYEPTIAYHQEPYLVFRQHDAQWSASPDRVLMEKDAKALRDEMCA